MTILAQLSLFPDQASTVAGHVDALFFFLLAITGAVAVAICVLIITFSIRYRRREGTTAATPRILGAMWMEVLWSTIPMLIFVGIFLWGAQIYLTLAQPPDDSLEIYVVGKQWMWKVQHPEGQREINELHVPLGKAVKLTLTSEDVIHDFFVPAFRTKQDAVPGRYSTTWFQPTKAGKYHLFCAEYCGTRHSGMIGWIYVMEPAEYEDWLAGGTASGSLADNGAKLFQDLACNNCHKPDGSGRGPTLVGL